jgi:hypothetical protein
VHSANRSIVMVDWSRLNEPTPRTRDEFLWHQMLLSLLYDDVFAQDETLVCSRKMARWFPDSESFGLLEQTFECGGISVLKRPWERYPQKLQEKALEQPIAARREHLEEFSVNNDGAPLRFDKKRREFHNRLEAFLAGHSFAHRHAGSQKKLGKDLMHEFGSLLAVVLTDGRYNKWLKSKFKNIKPETAEGFARFISDPNRAIERLERERPDRPPRFTPLSGGLVFSTALAVQVAATYSEKEAKELQSLIETVFARPFCQDEGAEGRYGRLLRDLPLPLEVEDGETGITDLVKVEVKVNVPLRLPWPGPNFADIIGKVRENPSGINLRSAMNQLGSEANFGTVRNAWQAVAEDIASIASSTKVKEIDLRMLVVEAEKGFLWGAMADFALQPPRSLDDVSSRLPVPLLGALFSVGGELYPKLRQADLERQRISEPLEKAVEFTCVRHPAVKSDQESDREGVPV